MSLRDGSDIRRYPSLNRDTLFIVGTRGEELFGAGMWSENAVRAHKRGRFALQRRHPDGRGWITVRTFDTKIDAAARSTRIEFAK
jgi:hypothetical protein